MLERQLLADNVPACQEFFDKYYDDKGYLQCFGAGPRTMGPMMRLRISIAGRNCMHWELPMRSYECT